MSSPRVIWFAYCGLALAVLVLVTRSL